MRTTTYAFVILAAVTAATPARADSELLLPTRLIKNDQHSFYTKQDVCEHSKKIAPAKKAAMVIVKTHYCDKSSQVCLKATSLVADRANHLVHDHFTVYQSRFESQRRKIINSGEKSIRNEWAKDDSGPEFYIVDVQSCEIIFREYAYSVYQQGMYRANAAGTHLDFEANYRALRELLLKEEAVQHLLGNQYQPDDEDQIKQELARAREIRQHHHQKSLVEVLAAVDMQDAQHGLKYQDN